MLGMLRGNTVSDAPLIIGSPTFATLYRPHDRGRCTQEESKVVPYKEPRYRIERKTSPLK